MAWQKDKMLNNILLLVIYLSLYQILIVNCWQEYEVEVLGQLNKNHQELFIYDMKPRRINRTSYAVSGSFVLKNDLRNYTV